MNAKNQEKVWQRLYGHDGKGVPKLCVSDRVRVSKYKGTFAKGYEIFTIHEVGRRTDALVKWFGYPSKFNRDPVPAYLVQHSRGRHLVLPQRAHSCGS